MLTEQNIEFISSTWESTKDSLCYTKESNMLFKDYFYILKM